MAEGEAPAPAALIEPDERSTVSLWSSTMRQANKVDEIALILKKMTALETKLADLEGERIKVRERSDVLPSGPLQLHGALLECAKEVRVLTGPVVGRVDSRSAKRPARFLRPTCPDRAPARLSLGARGGFVCLRAAARAVAVVRRRRVRASRSACRFPDRRVDGEGKGNGVQVSSPAKHVVRGRVGVASDTELGRT